MAAAGCGVAVAKILPKIFIAGTGGWVYYALFGAKSQGVSGRPAGFQTRFGAWKKLWVCWLDFWAAGVPVRGMKSKQLANVLIKIIGLYVCLCAIPGSVSGVLAIFTFHMGGTSDRLLGVFSYAIGDAVQAAIGIFLIIKSRKLAEFWFKSEDE